MYCHDAIILQRSLSNTRLKEELSQLGLPAFASAQLLEGKMERGAAWHFLFCFLFLWRSFQRVPAVLAQSLDDVYLGYDTTMRKLVARSR